MDWTLNPESSPETLDIEPSALYTLLQEEDLIFRKLVFDAVNQEIERAASVARRGEGARRQVISMVRGSGFDAGSRVHADMFFVLAGLKGEICEKRRLHASRDHSNRSHQTE
jgi:hypothetical protein